MSYLNEGGSFFMYPLLVLLIFILAICTITIIKKKNIKRTINLINTVGIFAIVWGFLGQIIGFIGAFEAIEMAADISPQVMAAGLRISFYAPIFGILIFLISKIEIFILTWRQKE